MLFFYAIISTISNLRNLNYKIGLPFPHWLMLSFPIHMCQVLSGGDGHSPCCDETALSFLCIPVKVNYPFLLLFAIWDYRIVTIKEETSNKAIKTLRHPLLFGVKVSIFDCLLCLNKSVSLLMGFPFAS